MGMRVYPPILQDGAAFGFAALLYINKLGRVGKQRALRAAPTQIAAAMACVPLLTLRGAN
jgi:hypothetical protein